MTFFRCKLFSKSFFPSAHKPQKSQIETHVVQYFGARKVFKIKKSSLLNCLKTPVSGDIPIGLKHLCGVAIKYPVDDRIEIGTYRSPDQQS